jgi:RimJ/RimL family protein N-acetyltransferase
MKTTLETERLLFRELLPSDAEAMFELDSDPDVVKYLGVKPLTHVDQTRQLIDSIRQQYLENGIGRWAVILKETNAFIGWAGLKFIPEINDRKNVYDLGYRFLKRHWGKGYGSESAKAFIDFGFNEMQLPRISAYIDVENVASQKILEKCGMKFTNTFMDEGDLCGWYEIENPIVDKI